jgi:hypothetical protein
VGRGVGGQLGQACEPGSGGLDDVATLIKQWPDLLLGIGDGAGDNVEEFGQDVLESAQVLAQHGDQGLKDAELCLHRGSTPMGCGNAQ